MLSVYQERDFPMSRVRTYVGPQIQVTPDEIGRYENGQWYAEEKRDGAWAEIKIDGDGKIVSLTSRVGKPFMGDHVAGLVGLQTELPNSTLVGELEAASEAATERYKALGYRRVHIFDAPFLCGYDLTDKAYQDRRQVLEQFVATMDPKRMPVVRRATHGFKAFYDSVMADGGEGLVFKKHGSVYRSHGGDGKVDYWVRCKPYSFVDYVVMSVGRSAGGSPNLQVGLHLKGKLTRVCTIKNTPAKLDLPSLVGRVIECKGAEVLKSGALRHGHFQRVRDDKLPEDCSFESLGK